MTTTGASSSGRPAVTDERSVHLHANTDGRKSIRKTDDFAKNFAPKSEEVHEICNQVLDGTCAKVEKYPNNLQEYPLNVAI